MLLKIFIYLFWHFLFMCLWNSSALLGTDFYTADSLVSVFLVRFSSSSHSVNVIPSVFLFLIYFSLCMFPLCNCIHVHDGSTQHAWKIYNDVPQLTASFSYQPHYTYWALTLCRVYTWYWESSYFWTAFYLLYAILVSLSLYYHSPRRFHYSHCYKETQSQRMKYIF